MAKCISCGGKAMFMSNTCQPCLEAANENVTSQARQRAQQEEVTRQKEQHDLGEIVLTTTPSIEGMRVTRTIDIVTSECVFGMNIFKDIFASFTDVFGGRSESSQKVLRDARNVCLMELRKEALLVGANAVIGIDLDYSEFSGGGKSMLFLVASGTAVTAKPIHSP